MTACLSSPGHFDKTSQIRSTYVGVADGEFLEGVLRCFSEVGVVVRPCALLLRFFAAPSGSSSPVMLHQSSYVNR